LSASGRPSRTEIEQPIELVTDIEQVVEVEHVIEQVHEGKPAIENEPAHPDHAVLGVGLKPSRHQPRSVDACSGCKFGGNVSR
jgi:hypothetical protein